MRAVARWLLIALFLVITLTQRGVPSGTAAGISLSKIRIAFTQNNNVYLMNADGSGRVAVTTDAGASPYTSPNYSASTAYPWYQWSPDGRYLLVVRERPKPFGIDYLLMDSQGKLLRVLPEAEFGSNPTWAVDADLIVGQQFTGSVLSGSLPVDTLISRVNTNGEIINQFHLRIPEYPCEAGWAPVSLWLYDRETGGPDFPKTISWSSQRNIAAIGDSCEGSRLVTDLDTGREQPILISSGAWWEGQISTTGVLEIGYAMGSCIRCIGIVDVRTGILLHSLGIGDFPAWSKSGKALFFTRRIPGGVVNMAGPVEYDAPEAIPDRIYTSSIWRANVDGTHIVSLSTLNAYGLGPLQVTPDGKALIFSSVDNPLNLYHHLLPGNQYNQHLLDLYGPRVSIRKLDLSTGKLTTILRNAGRPDVQP